MKRLSLIGLLVGLLVLTGLIAWQGLNIVSQTLNAAGWQVFWLPVFYLLPMVCALFSWRLLFPRPQVPPVGFTTYATWISFSINWLLPVGQVGGEIARVRMMLKRKFPAPEAIASVIGDQTLQVATQAIYGLLGFSLFIYQQLGQERNNRQLVLAILLGFVLFGVASFGLYWIQHAGLFRMFARVARKFEVFNAQSLAEEKAERLDAALKALYRRRDRLIISALWRCAFRVSAAGETWLALYFLGHPVTVGEALILESIGQAIRSAAFVIPGGLGAQEGGIVLVGAALGIPTDVALASSLCKRVRELSLGVPGLLVWQVEEGRRELTNP